MRPPGSGCERLSDLDDEAHDIYACRHNGIGLPIVRLLERRDNILMISGVDIHDGTPPLDIEPNIPPY